jgi:hypothetical protein
VKSNSQHHPGNPATGEDLNAIEQRRQQVAYLVAAHWTYRHIAAHLRVSLNTVALDVKAVRQAWRDRSAADYATFLDEEVAKLDLLERGLLPEALHGGPNGGVNLQAIDRVLAIRDRRARMLGLDAPSRVEVTMHVEKVAKAIELVVVEMGMDPEMVRPILGAKLRELAAITEN